MSLDALRQRVDARDRLVVQAEASGAELRDSALGALRRGDLRLVEAAILRHESQVRALAENLRIYQAELHAQADELAASQARTEDVMTRFAALFSNMPVAALLVAYNGAVIEHNGRALDLFELPSRLAPVRFLHRMVTPAQYQERVRPAFHEARGKGSAALDEVEFLTASGRVFLGELHIAALPATQGEEGQFACAVIDRTEHVQDVRALRESAEALRISEAFLTDSAQLARMGGWEYATAPRMLRWSREVRTVLEADADDEGSFEATLALCAPHSQPALVAALDAAALRGERFDIELDMITPGGRPMRVLASGHRDERPDAQHGDDTLGGGRTRVLGVFQDITGLYMARRQIGDLTERLSMAKDAGGIGIWDWDLARDKLFFDARMCELLGLDESPSANLRAAVEGRLRPDDAAAVLAALQRSVDHHEPLSVEVRLRSDDGQPERWLHLTGRAQYDGDEHAVRLVGCAWDCSPEKAAARLLAAKESAESASRAKSAFLSRMSHELRTPLNAILGFSQLMRMEAEAGDLLLKPHRVALIETAARHLLDLINEVLDVSRIESGQVDVRLQPLDLRDVVRDCLPLVMKPAEEAGITLHDATAGGPPLPVMGDRLRLKQVLINLLSNAVKYNSPGGRVDVGARITDDGVALDVADSGRGLAPEQLSGLFQPFNRLGAETTGIEGSGMGLFVSKRFVELMGGSIRVSSQPGVGTVFSVLLNAPPTA